MVLSLDIIRDNLPKYLNARLYGPERSALSLGPPIFFENGGEFEKGRLYVARSGALPNVPPRRGQSIVCSGANPPQQWLDGGCRVLLIPGDFSLFFVVNEIYKIYEKFNKWENELRDALEDEDNFDIIRKIVKLGAMILENPISISNGNMLHIFSTNMTSNSETGDVSIFVNEEYQEFEKSNANLYGFELIKDACQLERVIKEPYLSRSEVGESKYYCYNLYYPSGFYAGCASIRSSNRPFRDGDFALAD